MKTNANWLTVALLAVALSAPLAHAQTPAADSPGAPAPINVADARLTGPGKPRNPKHGDRRDDQRPDRTRLDPKHSGLTSLTTVSGTVGGWTSNDDYILDGFTLGAGSAPTTVKFPPHLGQQVQKAMKPGSSVSVTGYAENAPQGELRFRLVSLTAGKTTVADVPRTGGSRTGGSRPRRNQTDDTPTLVTTTGKIADYQISRNGRVNGLILDNKTIVRVPPHVAGQLSNLAIKGQTITVQGYPKEVGDGQVQLQKAQILRASVLTINGQQYLVR